jgi:hypothetical protein
LQKYHENMMILDDISTSEYPISSNIKFGSWFCFFQPRILQSSSSSDSVWIKIWWLDDSQFFCSSLGTLRFPTHPRRRPVKVLPVLAPANSGDHVARCSGCPWIGRPLNEVWCAFCSLWPKKSKKMVLSTNQWDAQNLICLHTQSVAAFEFSAKGRVGWISTGHVPCLNCLVPGCIQLAINPVCTISWFSVVIGKLIKYKVKAWTRMNTTRSRLVWSIQNPPSPHQI